jgi:uncharacterized protein YbjT (DUF2867 family)
MANMNYALFGATGAVGKALTAKLAKRRPTVPRRRTLRRSLAPRLRAI